MASPKGRRWRINTTEPIFKSQFAKEDLCDDALCCIKIKVDEQITRQKKSSTAFETTLHGRSEEEFFEHTAIGMSCEEYLIRQSSKFIDNPEPYNDLLVEKDWIMEVVSSDYTPDMLVMDWPDVVIDDIAYVRVEVKSRRAYGGYYNEQTKYYEDDWRAVATSAFSNECKANFFVFFEHNRERDKWVCMGLHYCN